MTPTRLIEQSVTRVVRRTRVFKVRDLDGISMILGDLLSERHTGVVTIVTSQGGVLEVRAEDTAKLSE